MKKEQALTRDEVRRIEDVVNEIGSEMRDTYVSTVGLSTILGLVGIILDQAAYEQWPSALYEIGSKLDYVVKGATGAAGLIAAFFLGRGLQHEHRLRKANEDLKTPGTDGNEAVSYMETYYRKAGLRREEDY